MKKTLLEHVNSVCEARKVRFTPQRKRVFELICTSKRAQSAYELLEQLKESEPQAKPPTIYRALDFLMEQGFIHKIESNNSFVSCCLCDQDKHFSQLLICNCCGSVAEEQDDKLTALLTSNADKHGFTVTHHVIETHGVCQECSLRK